MTELSCPDYKHPPVAEVVLGVQFEPLARFTNAHLGVFWTTLGEKWCSAKDASAIEPQFEKFDEAGTWRSFQMRLTLVENVTNRIQISNVTQDQMIQLQNGRLHFNWVGSSGAEYPRYPSVRAEFSSVFEHFIQYARDKGLGEVQPNQWEVTYVNHIPQGTVWNDPKDWGFFRSLQTDSTAMNSLVQFESFGGEWHYIIPPQKGRLHVQWRHGRRSGSPESPEQEVVILTLTARGPIDRGSDAETIPLSGLDLGHEVIVKSFRMLMSEDANKHWGLKNAGC